MKVKVALMGGMGYPVTETPWGMPTLKQRLEAIGAVVMLVNWANRQEVYDFMRVADGEFRAYLGDSLGAGSAAQYPGDVKGVVNYVGGFQPSVWDARASNKQITVAANVKRAHAIYDPVFIETMGLGNATYIRAHGASTIVMNTQHQGAHPDDWGWSQTLLFTELKTLIEETNK